MANVISGVVDPDEDDVMRFFTGASNASTSKDVGKKISVHEILSTTFEESVKNVGLGAMSKYSRGNILIQLGFVNTGDLSTNETVDLRRPNFDVLRAK